MTYKVLTLIVPLTISSIATLPVNLNFDGNKAVSSVLTFKPLDPIADDYFNCSTFGPFSLSTVTNNVNVSFVYQLYSISSQNIVERVRLFNSSNSVVSSASNASIYYKNGTRNTTSFNLRIRDYLTRNGLTLKFEIVRKSDYAVLKAYSTTFYPSSDAQISWVSLKQSPYVSQSLGFYSEDSQMKPLIETIDFTHFGDYLDIDYYYRLDINKNTISYPNNCHFTYGNVYLTFNDSDYLFPYLTHQSSGDVNIPLSLTRSDNIINLKYKNTFYINKRTLQISDTYRNGFVSTKDFYLPVNGMTKFNGKQLYFVLDGFGLDNISTTIPIKYETSRSLVGICKDGDYCIVGGRR